ncbi:hypothetical protein Tco_0316117 [Tanacetum coccineum]
MTPSTLHHENYMSCLASINRGIFKSVLTAVHFGTDGESFVAGTAGSVTVVSLYGPSKMHFLEASPFGFVSVYLKKRDCHYAYLPVASIGGRSLDPAAMMLLCI